MKNYGRFVKKQSETAAFSGLTGVTDVQIADTVDLIGKDAFSECKNLTEITIPGSVRFIGNYAFENNTKLTMVRLSEGVLGVGNRAFANCTNLSDVTLPLSLLTIGDYAFYHCSEGLENIVIPGGITEIPTGAFSCCYRLKTITIPTSVKRINEDAFEMCTPLSIVYYEGNLVQWELVDIYEIDHGNWNLKDAKIEYGTLVSMEDADIVLSQTAFLYTGSAHCPDTRVYFGENQQYEAREDVDFEIAYENNTELGMGRVIVTGKGMFEGQKTIEFGIYEEIISFVDECVINSTPKSATYTGAAIEPTVSVSYQGQVLVKDKDYTVKYANNVNAGTGSIIVQGLGPYYGTYTKKFTINKAEDKITTAKKTWKVTAKPTKAQEFDLGAKSLTGRELYYKSNSDKVSVDAFGTVTVAKNYAGKATITIYSDFKTFYDSIDYSEDYYDDYYDDYYCDDDYDDEYDDEEEPEEFKNYKPGKLTITFTVTKSVATKIKLPKSKKVGVGSTATIKPSLVYKCQKISGLKWSSSNKKVATVNSKGVVTGKKAGKATITCKLPNGTKYKCTVTVKKNEYVYQSYSKVTGAGTSYGDVKVYFLNAHYSGKKLIVELGLYNNRAFYARYFSWITFKVRYNDKVVKTYKMKKVPINLHAYNRKKITIKIPMSKVYNLPGASDFEVYDYDYYYYFYYHS